MATFPALTVPVFQAGYAPQASDFTNYWYNPASFMQNRMVLRASQATTATSLPSSGAQTLIGFDNIIEDPYGGWTGSPNYSWGPPAGYSGWFQVTGTVRTVALPNLTELGMTIGVWISAVPEANTYSPVFVQGASAFGAGVSGTFIMYLVGGLMAVSLYGWTANAGAAKLTSLTAGQQSTMEVMWLSSS